MEDASLVTRCQQGKSADFAKLYDKYIEKIYRFIYWRVQHKETAEDLTSQVFMKALNQIDSYDETKSTFATWIYRIARNTVIDHYRTMKQSVDIDDYWSLSDTVDIARDAEVRDKLQEVDQYLSHLSADQREIVLLRVWHGFSYKEIAELIGKTEASCKMVFSRVMTKLRVEIVGWIGFISVGLLDQLRIL